MHSCFFLNFADTMRLVILLLACFSEILPCICAQADGHYFQCTHGYKLATCIDDGYQISLLSKCIALMVVFVAYSSLTYIMHLNF